MVLKQIKYTTISHKQYILINCIIHFNKIKNNRLICCKLCVNNRTKAELYYKELYTFGEELYFQGLIDKKNLDQFKLIVADSNDSNQLVIL